MHERRVLPLGRLRPLERDAPLLLLGQPLLLLGEDLRLDVELVAHFAEQLAVLVFLLEAGQLSALLLLFQPLQDTLVRLLGCMST